MKFNRWIPKSLITASFSQKKVFAVTWFVSLEKETENQDLETIHKHIATVEQELVLSMIASKTGNCDAIHTRSSI